MAEPSNNNIASSSSAATLMEIAIDGSDSDNSDSALFRSQFLTRPEVLKCRSRRLCFHSRLGRCVSRQSGAGPKWSRVVYFEPFIETVDVQWPPEMSKGNDLVAETVSHPPGQGYEEKAISTANSTPTKYAEPPKEETFVDVKVSSSVGFRHCEMCEKEVHGEQSVSCNWCCAVVYYSALCQKQHWKETHKGMCGLYKAMMEREECNGWLAGWQRER